MNLKELREVIGRIGTDITNKDQIQIKDLCDVLNFLGNLLDETPITEEWATENSLSQSELKSYSHLVTNSDPECFANLIRHSTGYSLHVGGFVTFNATVGQARLIKLAMEKE